ncbi:MAG: tol-pal system-associated acyl-CoA thioesterase [Candidatus Parabeggiatoa sp. nov. 2]|nr:MAG: tol-pal system-associated acyl-CoA thioesterase [Beggiatoa sp. 4572_84]RKZ52628.1 MAG: tol-pal system-associated acyl-CoA thioesterase [Gammaproteobacteria bacterium]
MNEFIWPIRVYYEDTDAGGFVYHTNYLKFMERARTEWLRELGFEQTQLRAQYNLVFVVRQLSIDYLKTALFNDLLHINTSLTHMGKVRMTLTQQVLRDAEILCTAVVKIAAINVIKQRPQAIPPDILKALRLISDQ